MTRFTPLECAIATMIAERRTAACREGGVEDKLRSDKISGARADLIGVLGEMGFCKSGNYWPDLSSYIRSGGRDCTGRDGLGIDVKGTSVRTKDMMCSLAAKDNPDIQMYAQVYVDIGSSDWAYELTVYCTADELWRPENIKNKYGKVDEYCLPQSQCRKFHKPRQPEGFI